MSDAVTQNPAVGDLIVRAVQRYADRTAFVSDDREISYSELGQSIGRAQRHLETLGLRAGDAIVQLGCNRVEQFVLMAACYLSGLRSVTLQPALHAIDLQAQLIARCDPKLVVFDLAHAERAGALKALLPAIPLWRCHQAGAEDADFWAEAGHSPYAAPANHADPEDIVRIGFTSGTTTGIPKGVLLSARALAALAIANLADGDWPETPRVLCAEAIAGGFGNMILPTMIRGGTFLLQEDQRADVWLDAVARWRPSVGLLMPWSMERIVHHPEAATHDLSSLSLVAYSGAVLPDRTMGAALGLFGPILSQVFGQTEFPKAVAILTKADHATGDRDRLRSIGLPYSGTTAMLLDEHCMPVDDGLPGELCIRGPAVFSGYLDDPVATKRAFRDGWYRTGDLCRRGSNGYLHYVDRLEDLIRSEGQTFAPSEIERSVKASPGVRDAAALKLDDATGRFRLALLIAGNRKDIDPVAIAGILPKGISWNPSEALILEALPRTLIGRLDRRALRSIWDAARSSR